MVDREQVRERLFDMGINPGEGAERLLEECIERSEQTILNYCNIEYVPEDLRFVAMDLAVGEYLAAVRGREDMRGVSSVSEGDVSVKFSDKDVTEEEIDRILRRGIEELTNFRRVRW